MNIDELPQVGFGTYPLKGETCTQAVKAALYSGYHLIDTATYYDNFEAIRDAIADVERENIYIMSKVWYSEQTPQGVRKDIEQTLERLSTPYLDGYLLHWPNHRLPFGSFLEEVNRIISEGKVRHFGLSNVTVAHLERALQFNTPITWVQNEMHPHFYDPSTLAFCKKHSIHVQAWRPLNKGRLDGDDLTLSLAEKYGKSQAHIALKWIVQHGCMPLPGSQNKEHIQSNIAINDFSLTQNEMERLNQRAAKGVRYRLDRIEDLGICDEFDLKASECWPQ